MQVQRPVDTPSDVRRGVFRALFIFAILGLAWGSLPRPVMALDPQRPLTQALLRIWQVQQGLPRAAIFSIRQTHDGYLWLGTQVGLYRFDGVRFVAIQGGGGRSLANLWIQDLSEDQNHNLWMATDDAGLVCLKDRTITSVGRTEGLPSEHVRCLLVDRRGELWVGTDKGLARYQNGKFVVYRTAQGLPADSIRALSEAPDGTIWIATEGQHICTWNGSQFKASKFNSIPPRGTINALLAGSDGTVWIGTTAGLIRRKGSQERLFTQADGLANDLIYCLTRARDGGVWVGTKDGISRIQENRVESFRTRDGLSQSTAYTLCEDHEGSLWVGTKHGLNQFADRRTLPFTVTEGLPSNDTGPILQDQAGKVWVGTLGAGLARFDGRQFSNIATTSNGLLSNTILSLADGGSEQLWIGTDQGLCRMRDGQIVDSFTMKQGLPSNVILALGRDSAGALWAGTSAGLAEFRDGRFVPPDGDSDAIRRPVQALVNYRNQFLIAAAAGGGVYQLADRKLSLLTDRLQTSHDIDAFYLDEDNRLWMAIRGRGVGLFDGQKFSQFSVKDGLYDDDIFGIASDDQGRLWMACSRGIFSVARTDLVKFAEGKITRLVSYPFSPTDALRTIECQDGVQPAIWKMQDGSVWFSTIRGIIVLDPKRLSRKLPPPSIVIEEVRVNGQEVSPQQIGRLPPGRTNFDFHYTALSFAAPTRITFRYRLEGFDPDWVDAGQRREAFYTNLHPGTYRFRVQAINADGSGNEAAHPVDFTLEPYFYQTRWFIPLIVTGLAALGWLAYRRRIHYIKMHLQVVLAERTRIARELHDTLIQGFSGVTMQMQALTTRLRQSPERETLAEIIHDAGNCLSEARRSVGGLRNVQGDESGLAAAIAQAARQLTEGRDTRLRLQLAPNPPQFSPDTEYNILRIVQEAISNAIKHSGASLIEVSLGFSPHKITISVADDGSGFDMDQYLEHIQPGHYGLIGMRERATQIGADISWRSVPRQGTTVTLIQPLSSQAIPSVDSPLRTAAGSDQAAQESTR